jgi:membrane protein DedA with SNARE-associated domain
VQQFLVHFKYLAVLAALVASGVGVPIPEEVTQLTAGALAHQGILDWRITIPVAWAGIVGGDALLFTLAQRNAERLLSMGAVRRVLTPARREWLQRYFAKHAFLTIMVARHASGFRLATFVFAATQGVRLTTFVLADALSALVSVPLVVGAGYLFSRHLSQAQRELRIVELAILAAIALTVGIIALVRRRRRIA